MDEENTNPSEPVNPVQNLPNNRLVSITSSPKNQHRKLTPSSAAGKTQMLSIQRLNAKKGKNT